MAGPQLTLQSLPALDLGFTPSSCVTLDQPSGSLLLGFPMYNIGNAPPTVRSERAGAERALCSSLSQQLPLQHLENQFLKCWFSGKQEQPSTPGPLPAPEPVGCPVEGIANTHALIKSKFQNVCTLSRSLHRGKREQELHRLRKKIRPFWKDSHTQNHGVVLKGGVKTGAGLRSPGCWCGISPETANAPSRKVPAPSFSSKIHSYLKFPILLHQIHQNYVFTDSLPY